MAKSELGFGLRDSAWRDAVTMACPWSTQLRIVFDFGISTSNSLLIVKVTGMASVHELGNIMAGPSDPEVLKRFKSSRALKFHVIVI
eukprot:CAMPEP_0169074356 /NCGR_PEP_ID=MMETSP1015-20121227/7229_1 /TAXON_ID=342587 /ORGANISM="Karlodinium micrum, Strain CCMP2283" /LENGTH=86 /DNA_ID=CAMNT_0009133663 /DNA_START=25 /DNA_END=286 /DNA_ORIENTATION=-